MFSADLFVPGSVLYLAKDCSFWFGRAYTWSLSLVLIWFFSLSMGRGNWVTYGVELVVANKPDGALFARLPSSWKKKIQIFRTYSSSGALRNCYSSNVGLQSDTNVIKLDFSF